MVSLPDAFWKELSADWSFDANRIALKSRVDAPSDDLDALRALGERAGDHDTITLADGTQRCVPTHGREQLTIDPPERFCPPFSGAAIDAEVASYNDGVDPAEATVSLQLDRSRTREPTDGGGSVPLLDQSAGDGEWEIELRFGTIAVDETRVSGSEQKAGTRSLTVLLGPEAAALVDATLGNTASVGERDPADGVTDRIDHHPEDRNTLAIRPASSATDAFAAGEFVASSWSLSHLPPNRWEWSLTIDRLSSLTYIGGTTTVEDGTTERWASPLVVAGRLDVAGRVEVTDS